MAAGSWNRKLREHISRLSQEAEKVNWKWVRLQPFTVTGFLQQGFVPPHQTVLPRDQVFTYLILSWLLFYYCEEAP